MPVGVQAEGIYYSIMGIQHSGKEPAHGEQQTLLEELANYADIVVFEEGMDTVFDMNRLNARSDIYGLDLADHDAVLNEAAVRGIKYHQDEQISAQKLPAGNEGLAMRQNIVRFRNYVMELGAESIDVIGRYRYVFSMLSECWPLEFPETRNNLENVLRSRMMVRRTRRYAEMARAHSVLVVVGVAHELQVAVGLRDRAWRPRQSMYNWSPNSKGLGMVNYELSHVFAGTQVIGREMGSRAEEG